MSRKRLLWTMGKWIVVALLMSLTAQARELSLKQALELAVQHSHRLKKAAAERQASESALGSAKAARLPSLSVQAFAFYNNEVPSFDIDLPLGQTISREVGSKENYQTDLRLSVPLYTGGKISGKIGAASATVDLYRALEDANLDQLLYQTRLEYLSLYRADRLFDVTRASQKRAAIIRDDVHSLFLAGAADSVDLLETDLAWAQADFKVKEAASLRRSAEIRLIILLNLLAEDSLVILDVLRQPQSMETEDACVPRAELRAAKAAVALSRAQVRLAQSAYFPTISAYGGYSYGKPNLDFFNNTWNDYFTVGARLSWSFNVGRKERFEAQRAEYSYHAAQRERDETVERLEREKQLALESLGLAYQKYETAQYTYEIASDNYRLAVQKHRRGAMSSNHLLQVETSLSEAEAVLAAALVDYYIAQSAHYFSIGSEKLRKGL
jgi:outer membrane protein TolC